MGFWGAETTPEYLAYLAGLFYIIGLAITNQIVLRLLILAGTSVYILYYSNVAVDPLWEAIYVSLLIGVSNIGGLTSLIARRSRLAVPRAHKDVYDDFPELPPGDFRALMSFARRYSLEEDQQVTAEGMPGHKLYYIIKGEVLVRKSGQAFVLPPGLFLGEVAFLTGVPSSATVWVEKGAEILEWRFADLERKCSRSPRFKLALEAAISIDLAQKVAGSMGKHSVEVEKIPRPMVDALTEVGRV